MFILIGRNYYGASAFDPTLGRFLQEDPVGYLMGPNLYIYVNNNPINCLDPWGLKLYKISGGSVAASIKFGVGFSGAVYEITDVSTGDTATYLVVGGGLGIGGSLDISKERFFDSDIENVSDFAGWAWELNFVPLAYKQAVSTKMGIIENYTGVGGVTLGVELSGNRVYYWPLDIEMQEKRDLKKK